MNARSLLAGAASTLAIVLPAYLLGCAAAPPPEASPVPTTVAPERPPEMYVPPPPVEGEPPATFPGIVETPPAASPEAAAPAAGEPTPAPAEAGPTAQQQRLAAELTAARAKADAAAAAFNAECPELRPGEVRHPGALARCGRLRAESAHAASQYEAVKKQAQAAGVAVQ